MLLRTTALLWLTCASLLADTGSLAVIGIQTAPGTDARESWLTTAVEETLSRRLRYAGQLRVVPPVRLHLAQRELQDPGQPLPDWPKVTRLLGVKRIVGGTVGGYGDATQLTLQLQGTPGGSQSFGPAPLPQVLDEATDWLFEQYLGKPIDAKIRATWHGKLTSPSPIEYYAKAVEAARQLSTSDAIFYLERALQYENAPRSVVLMSSEMQIRLGEAARQQALSRLRSLLSQAKTQGDSLAELEIELTYANAQLTSGAYGAATLRQKRALELAEARGDIYAIISARNALADVALRREARPDPNLDTEKMGAFRREQLTIAAEQLRAVLQQLETLGDMVGQAPLTNKLALIYERLRRDEEAGAMHQRTLELARETKSVRTEATALIFLGQWHKARGDIDSARKSMEACLKLAPPESKPKVHIALADVLAEAEQYAGANVHYQAAYDLLESGDDLLNQMVCLERMARMFEKQNRKSDARRRWQEALDIAEVLELPDAERLRTEMNK